MTGGPTVLRREQNQFERVSGSCCNCLIAFACLCCLIWIIWFLQNGKVQAKGTIDTTQYVTVTDYVAFPTGRFM